MPASNEKKYLLLDSCVTEYLLNKHMHAALSNQIQTWAGETFDLAISEISYAELIDGAYKDKITRVKELLDSYTRIEVTQRVLSGAGLLSNIYKTHDGTNKDMSLADKIIAATAFIYNLPIVTANVKDFPHPFFVSVESENIIYKKKRKTALIVVDVLKPNAPVLNYWYGKTK